MKLPPRGESARDADDEDRLEPPAATGEPQGKRSNGEKDEPDTGDDGWEPV